MALGGSRGTKLGGFRGGTDRLAPRDHIKKPRLRNDKAMAKIDMHAHVIPPSWREACMKHGHAKPDGMPEIPAWTPEEHLDLMRNLGVTKTILSITSPGTHLKAGDDALGRKVAREANEYCAELKRAQPGKFGFFASLPIPDVQGSIEEIHYALDHLDADGFTVTTNAHGVYLGDKMLDPIFKILHERKALLFMHPTSGCVKGMDPTVPLSEYPRPMLEFFFDTTRAVVNLILSGTVDKYPGVKYIVPHCGAVLPPLIERFTSFSTLILQSDNGVSSERVKELFKSRFYFDLAGFPFPDQIHGLLRYTDTSRLFYGSDYPYTPGKAVLGLNKVMDAALDEMVTANVKEDIYHRNAERALTAAV